MAIPGELLIGGHRFKVDLVWQKQDWGRATFHRYRSGFVYGVAERLGWY